MPNPPANSTSPTTQVNNVETPLTPDDLAKLKCRPDDEMEKSYFAETAEPRRFSHQGKEYPVRAPKTTANSVTAWWDASQLYGYDEISRQRVKRDPGDPAKLLLEKRGNHNGAGRENGYLPLLKTCPSAATDCMPDPGNPAWVGQEATAFADNWTVGLSVYHNVFAREHNLFVDEFCRRAAASPDADSSLRNAARPAQVIHYRDVDADVSCSRLHAW